MYTFKIYSEDLSGMFLVPFHRVLQKTKHFKLTLGEISQQITNGIDIRKYYEEGNLYIRGGDVKRCQVNLLTCKKVNLELKDVPEKIKLKERDILITRKGTVGITSLVSKEFINSIIGTEIIKVRLKENLKNLSPEYVYTFINSDLGIFQVQGKLTGTVSRGINHRSLRGIKIPELSEEQHDKIYNWVKEAKNKHSEAIEKIEKAKKILMSCIDIELNKNNNKSFKVFSNNLEDIFTPKFYYPLYLRVVKKLSEKFKLISLNEISDIIRGNEVGSINYKTYIDKEETDIPFIRTSDLVNYEIDDYPDFYIVEDIYKELKQDLRPQDILISNDGKIGLSTMLIDSDKCIIQSHIRRVRIKNKDFTPEYVFTFLTTKFGLYQIYQRIFIQSTIPTIGDRLGEVKIPKIAEEKQKTITDLIKQALKLKKEKKELIKKAKTEIESMFLK